jgi:hypothetical protein
MREGPLFTPAPGAKRVGGGEQDAGDEQQEEKARTTGVYRDPDPVPEDHQDRLHASAPAVEPGDSQDECGREADEQGCGGEAEDAFHRSLLPGSAAPMEFCRDRFVKVGIDLMSSAAAVIV